MWLKLLFPVVAVSMLSGCAAYNQVLVNADGKEVFCDSVGAGLFWVQVAHESYESCINSRRAAGYLEVEKIGAIGAAINDQGFIRRLSPNGPASMGGLQVNDQLVAINGVPTKDGKEIRALLFVVAGTSVKLRVNRAGTELDLSVPSVPWIEINGFGPNKPGNLRDCGAGQEFKFGMCYPIAPALGGAQY